MTSWIVGNWKQNPLSIAEANALSTELINKLAGLNNTAEIAKACNLLVIPSTLHIPSVAQILGNDQSDILLGCQDVGSTNALTGAYTGDCSAGQMANIGVQWSLVGHSERRQYHNESSEILSSKINHALSQGLGVIFCIGESLQEYESGNTLSVLSAQLTSVLEQVKNLTTELNDNKNITQAPRLIVAYEPVWAIGTGKIPTLDEVNQAHQEIKHALSRLSASLSNTAILYGGSVNPDNASEFANSPFVDGVLVGGASLVADKFINIARTFTETKSNV